jgi:DNA mismatch endonuclease (patch repair protein)
MPEIKAAGQKKRRIGKDSPKKLEIFKNVTAGRSRNMRRIRSKDTSPERMVRSLTHGEGFRFRLHVTDLPGTPDLVFPSRRKVIFVHGCFWHSHLDCKLAHAPKSNKSYWGPKLKRNRQRDKVHYRELTRRGWRSLVVWECELARPDDVLARVVRFLERG